VHCAFMGRIIASSWPGLRNLPRLPPQHGDCLLCACHLLFVASAPLLVMLPSFLAPMRQNAISTFPHGKPFSQITRRALTSGSSAYSLAECIVQTPLDTAEVKLEFWLVGQRGQDDFIHEVNDKHRSLHRDFEQRNLRRYEKGVFQLFNVRCWPREGPMTEAGVCAECYRTKVRKVASALGQLLLPELEMETNIDVQSCFGGAAEENPQCLRSSQTLASDGILNVPFPMGQDDD